MQIIAERLKIFNVIGSKRIKIMLTNPPGKLPKIDFIAICITNLNGGQPHWKTTSILDELNGRQPQFILMSTTTIFQCLI